MQAPEEIFKEAASDIFGEFGKEGVYEPVAGGRYVVNVIKAQFADDFLSFPDGVERKFMISLQCDQIDAKPGDTVTIGADSFLLVKKTLDDGLETRWAVRRAG